MPLVCGLYSELTLPHLIFLSFFLSFCSYMWLVLCLSCLVLHKMPGKCSVGVSQGVFLVADGRLQAVYEGMCRKDRPQKHYFLSTFYLMVCYQ